MQHHGCVAETCTLGILSDIHYASAAEQARGDDYEYADLRNPLLRHLLRLHRRFVWLRDPLRQNHLLEAFLQQAGPLDYVVANGDYSCDSRFVGVSDEAAARVCGSAWPGCGSASAPTSGPISATTNWAS